MKTNDIFVAPVKKYAPPKYPTQTEAKFKPELLRKLPSRWQKNAAVVAAAGLFGAMTLTSCGFFDSDNSDNPESKNPLNVAPLFIHGEGTGSIGCVMIAPPVFLSEQEALAIIKSVAENESLKFEAEPPEYIATKNKPDSKYSWENNYTLGDGNIGLDLYDGKKGVAVSYIAMEEAEQKYKNMISSVTAYRPRELAEMTVEDFAKQKGDMNIGVFYDPGIEYEVWQPIIDKYQENENYEEAMVQYEADIKAVIEENLRAQVRDFIEWLQGQGII